MDLMQWYRSCQVDHQGQIANYATYVAILIQDVVNLRRAVRELIAVVDREGLDTSEISDVSRETVQVPHAS